MAGTDVVTDHVRAARRAFASGRTRDLEWRRAQLGGISRMLEAHTPDWERALKADLGKPTDEAHLTEIGIVLSEVRRARARLRRWATPRRVPVPWELQPASARVRPEPLGTALIIAPWNYPVQLLLAPLVGALAAGCTAVLKPSEIAPATAALIERLAPWYLDTKAVRVVTGGPETATELLEEQYDIIFYTGGERVARIVAAAAARNLTPTVLELGGACPVWVDRSADLRTAARRIAWGKFLGAGQTCVAPNHVFVDRAVHGEFVQEVQAAIREQLGDDPRVSPDYGRIIHKAHLERLVGYLSDGVTALGGAHDAEARYLAPTVLDHVDAEAPSVAEEIFGPILPIVPLDGVDTFVALQRDRPKPLALYAFAGERGVLDRIERETTSGAFGRNVAVAHLQVPGLPFGGVGSSGHGAYHGKRGFDAFSHDKAILSKPTFPDTLQLVTPPITATKRALIRGLITRS